MNTRPLIAALSRDEVAVALNSLCEDPDAARVDAVHSRVDVTTLPDGDRAEVVRAAVEQARARLDAEKQINPARDLPSFPGESAEQQMPEKFLLTLTRREEKILEFIATQYGYAEHLRAHLKPEEEELNADGTDVDHVYSLTAADAARFVELVRNEEDGRLPMMAGNLLTTVDRLVSSISAHLPPDPRAGNNEFDWQVSDEHGKPDPEDKNDQRAEWANTALVAFMRQTRADRCDAVCDLLANLMHYCDRSGDDFMFALQRGIRHYGEETSPNGMFEPDTTVDLTHLVDDAEELKEMKEEINGDYTAEDLAAWDARLMDAGQIVQVLKEIPLVPFLIEHARRDLVLNLAVREADADGYALSAETPTFE
ncbi:hypothetical protein R70006_05040 [Paraburkholderia domus]|uniref:hypothetical protein n=1 Tax=Paraburkholderia domus TaxID=2793075 RepID=UPI001913C87E|nr:hypothetical protein [Paraburkholderia domus]MBK5051724.1 hypothetical protein [Burkholderia sp. R-70006]CAE6795204.1 hypothetical protein R70006_05040 [Paraburkholderia domus]